MIVELTVMLSGGHRVSLPCDDGDPSVLGVIAALPGANVSVEMPADGLIQIGSRDGRRLFVTRQSLVGVELRDLPNESAEVRGAAHSGALNAQTTIIPDRTSEPAPAVMFDTFLEPSVLESLRAGNETGQSAVALEATQAIAEAIRRSRSVLGLPETLATELELKLMTGSKGTLAWPSEAPSDDEDLQRALVCALSIADHAGDPPCLRLHDRAVQGAQWVRGRGYRDIPLAANLLTIFPGNVHFEVIGASSMPLVVGLLRVSNSTF